MSTDALPRKLWEHPDPTSTQIHAFKTYVEKSTGQKLPDYHALFNWSISEPNSFWLHCFRHFPLVYSSAASVPASSYDKSGPPAQHPPAGPVVPHTVFTEQVRMDTIPFPRWFPGIQMNFAQNILFTGDENGRPTTRNKEDGKVAVTAVREGSFNEPIVNVTWGELRERVAELSSAMRARGLKKGDRVGLVASTCVDTLVVFLAATAVGAIFSSSSTDMGVKGLLDRLHQIRPRWVFVEEGAIYNGKKVDLRSKMADLVNGMEGYDEFEGIVGMRRWADEKMDLSSVPRSWSWDDFVSKDAKDKKLVFESCEFSDPFIIVYSSGTTGQPKCIVHSIGGVVLNGHKEARLHRQIDHTSTQLQYTTTGWIMYLGSVQALLTGCRMVAYDGSPFLPDLKTFLKLLAKEKVTHFGTSPRYLQTLQQAQLAPRDVVDLSSLRVVTCTGMVLSEALFEWFYDVGFPKIVQLDNISGGTDLAGAFGTGCPILPVYSGGCQCFSLGMDVKVFDSTIEPTDEELREGKPMKGKEVQKPGEPGDLVCATAFPTMPLYFYGDTSGKKYFASYYGKYDGVWTHGDFIAVHPVTKQVVFLGRADGVLNPSGVRFGSSEIYSVIEKHFTESISDTICVGQRRPQDTDEKVLLFVLMKPGHRFTKTLIRDIKQKIAQETSKRHVPAFIFETKEIPTTVNGKKVELPVKQIVSGKKIKPSGTLGNPESLEYYYRFAEDANLHEIEQAKL